MNTSRLIHAALLSALIASGIQAQTLANLSGGRLTLTTTASSQNLGKPSESPQPDLSQRYHSTFLNVLRYSPLFSETACLQFLGRPVSGFWDGLTCTLQIS
jgi:hypothetical protein